MSRLVILWYSNCTSKHLLKRNEISTQPTKHSKMNVPGIINLNSWKMAPTQICISWEWINMLCETYVYMMEYYLVTKHRNTDACYKVNDFFKHCTKGKQSKRHILMMTFLWNVQSRQIHGDRMFPWLVGWGKVTME